jgi:hypothetical protein
LVPLISCVGFAKGSDFVDEPILHNAVDCALDSVEFHFDRLVVDLGQFENRPPKHLICVGPANQDFLQKHFQPFNHKRRASLAKVLLEGVERAGVLDLEESEVWEELFETILDGCTRDGPSILSTESSYSNAGLAQVVLD